MSVHVQDSILTRGLRMCNKRVVMAFWGENSLPRLFRLSIMFSLSVNSWAVNCFGVCLQVLLTSITCHWRKQLWRVLSYRWRLSQGLLDICSSQYPCADQNLNHGLSISTSSTLWQVLSSIQRYMLDSTVIIMISKLLSAVACMGSFNPMDRHFLVYFMPSKTAPYVLLFCGMVTA